MARTINDAIRGSILGATFYQSDPKTYIQNSLEIQAIVKIINLFKKYDGFWLENIQFHLAIINEDGKHEPNDGMVLCWIYLAAFSDMFVNHRIFDTVVEQICRATHDCDESVNASIEYCHLLHDIFYGHVDKDDILKIIPELDILAGDVPVDKNIRRILMASIWAFVHSNDFDSALINCRELNGDAESINWIHTVTGTLAGLYYGIEINDNSEFGYFIKPLMF